MTRAFPKFLLALFTLFVMTGVVAGEVAGADRIYGDRVTSEDIKGRVVFSQYSVIRCAACRESFPRLIEMQEKYFKTGKFTFLASHLQRDENKAQDFCKKQKVTFPVFHQFREARVELKKLIEKKNASSAFVSEAKKLLESM